MFTVVIEHSVTLVAFPDVIQEKTNTGGEGGRACGVEGERESERGKACEVEG